MRTTFFFIILSSIFLLASCGGADNNTPDTPTTSASLYGTVVDSKTGNPISAAIVTIRSMICDHLGSTAVHGDYHWGHTYSAVTGYDGSYEIPNIDKADLSRYGFNAIEKYYVSIKADGYQEHQSYVNEHVDWGPEDLGCTGWEFYTIVIDAGQNVQYDAVLTKE